MLLLLGGAALGSAVLLAAVGAGGLRMLRASRDWRSSAQIDLRTEQSRTRLEGAAASAPARHQGFDSYLVIGSDARAAVGGSRADVLMLVLLPRQRGTAPVVVSFPRDLYVRNPCAHGMTRVNAGLNGCGAEATGPQLLSVMLEDFTGIRVDHFAQFDFAGFQQVIDAVGGIDICVPQPVREPGLLQLPAGCTRAGGAVALSWVRSRHTQVLAGGRWRPMPGVSDLARNRRQQDVLLALLGRLGSFHSLASFDTVVRRTAGAVRVDRDLPLSRVIATAWRLRGTDPATVRRVEIPVRGTVTAQGADVLLPTKPFAQVLGPVYPEAVRG
jgi:LCP family protein required for cell wall assembly